jgi:ABC-type transporter Mla subunit MlaD
MIYFYIVSSIKMQKYARLTGYSVTLTLLAALLFVTIQLREGVLFPYNRVKVRFPTIGTLMEGDAVKLNGVEVGRVNRIEAGEGTAIATLELYRKMTLAKDTRFINYNYSLFGARMVILVPGDAAESMDQNILQEGNFSSGVTESIHKVSLLLNTIVQYQSLAKSLQIGNDTTPSLQQLLTTQVYPALEDFSQFAQNLQALQIKTESELEVLVKAGGEVNSFSQLLAKSSDTLVIRANRTLEQLTLLTERTSILLRDLDKIILAAQDTTTGPGRILVQRDLYNRTLTLTQGLQNLVKAVQRDGVKDIIHFWRNVNLNLGKPNSP